MSLLKTLTGHRLLNGGQVASYYIGDAGDYKTGGDRAYIFLTTGQYSGTVNLDVPHYAATGLAFVNATSKITDSGSGLVTFLTNDIVVVKGSANNDGVYTVATGGVAGEIVVNETLTNEAAGSVIKLYKRAAHSNNVVRDTRTSNEWSRYTSNAEDVGVASDGQLSWYDAATCYVLHGAAADLQMIAATNTLRIVGGAGEIATYDVGDPIVCSGFADADNNLPGWVIQSVTINGADLDLVLGPPDSNKLADLADEAAGGARDIKLVCRSIGGYVAAANVASLGGYTDWRIPDDVELINLRNMEAPNALPDATAFPSWPATYVWSSTTLPSNTSVAMLVLFSSGYVSYSTKSTAYVGALVRG